jgi:hypothetical protein
MFQQLFERPHALDRQLTGPLLEERLRYLHHCAQQGSASRTLREIAIYQLVVIRYLHLTNQRKVRLPEIETAAARWARRQSKVYGKAPTGPCSKARFRRRAVQWFSFLEWLEIPLSPPIAPELAAFIDYMRKERGLCEETIEGRRHSVERLLDQMGRRGYSLDRLTLTEVDTFLLERYRQGHYAPRTIQTQASGLRAFFRYAESRRWCQPGIYPFVSIANRHPQAATALRALHLHTPGDAGIVASVPNLSKKSQPDRAGDDAYTAALALRRGTTGSRGNPSDAGRRRFGWQLPHDTADQVPQVCRELCYGRLVLRHR